MKANELRIGNIILVTAMIDRHHSETREVIVNSNTFKLCEKYPEKHNPIPLTEEWLLKFGFENGVVKGGFSFDKNKLSIHLKSTSYPNGRTYFNSWCILEYAVKYVHQLQNLYFELKDKELEIN